MSQKTALAKAKSQDRRQLKVEHQSTKDDIVSRGHQIFFRYGTISVSGLKKFAEKVGMRAAPYPTERTKAMVKDPPPAEMEVSPAAVRESKVRQADPTNPLKDLAEEED
ncbi:hypothetical protein ACLKA7_001338 [Drosophila subpalustris]